MFLLLQLLQLLLEQLGLHTLLQDLRLQLLRLQLRLKLVLVRHERGASCHRCNQIQLNITEPRVSSLSLVPIGFEADGPLKNVCPGIRGGDINDADGDICK